MSTHSVDLRSVLRGAALLVVALTALVGFGACKAISPSGFSGDVDVLLTRGEAYLANLAAQSPDRLSDPEVLALGYAERVRLGLGSPFRTVDYVLRDPDLPESVKDQLAYGLLARTLAGRSYHVDPIVVDMARLSGVPREAPVGYHQLKLIERAIETAPSATAGERTVRLAYLLAASERTVDPGYTSVIAHVAAMLADRRRSQEDAALLLRTAGRNREDPLTLLQAWRRDGRFRVEQPPLAGVTIREEEFESREAPGLALALRAMAQRLTTPTSRVWDGATASVRDPNPLLSPEAAERLLELSDRRDYPAQAPIAVAVEINREGLLTRSGLDRAQRAARHRFVEVARNEERLIAGAATLHASGAHQGQRVPLILLQAATFLRVWNQEDPWFPGDPAPTARDLEGRFGLASIRFDADLEESWRPYYLRMLGRSLMDLQRVLPTASFRGLTIVIGEIPSQTRALALHEPRTRALYLPPSTGAGTLAHELAHDLDWQLARRRYGARGGYATDMAVRDNRGDRIASAMMELSASLVQPMSDVPPSAHATRPAEVFARGIDWLVAAMLARDGRLGGYLTSFQDPILTGYGTTRGPDIGGGAVPALISILDAVAPVVDETREWALETYGPSRALTGMELASAVTDAGAGLPAQERLQRIADVGLRSYEAIADCRYGSGDGVRRVVDAQRALARASLEAAARGAAIDAVHALAADYHGPEIRPAVEAWLGWRLYGAPEPVEPLLDALVPAFTDLLAQAVLAPGAARGETTTTAFHVGGPPRMCGGNPFAADTPVGRFRTPAKRAAF
jgi:hypothetical protein